ncbi:MAG: Fic family protein [Patescibacteria group bacterium]|jgi:Fic family protein|nr:Fic family protein [Patescibacteria group bacterium]
MNYKDQLIQILDASGWTQEQLAAEIGVSFPALNAWINNRAVPREKAQARIRDLFIAITGTSAITESDLVLAKKAATVYSISAKQIMSNSDKLNKLTLYLTYHTNNIEGSTMTLADVNDVIFDNKVLSNRSAIEQLEAKNHQAALYWLIEHVARAKGKFSITEELILNIHLRLMNGIVSDAGQYRKHTVRIMGSHVALANWQKVPSLIHELADARYNTDDSIAFIAKTHAIFEKIHPFSDGNGRTGRLLMLAQALNAKLPPPIVLKERKKAYYRYLEIAQANENYKPLELFIAEAVLFSGTLLEDTKNQTIV